MAQDHIDKFWICFPSPPAQPSVGDFPHDYLSKLNEVCTLTLAWPTAHQKGQLNRTQLRCLCRDSNVDVLIAYAAVMAWGGRGVHSRNYCLSLSANSLKNLRSILQHLRISRADRQDDFDAMQKTAAKIKGLGISFYTKLLFFFRIKPDAYILDQFTAKSAKLLFDDCKIVLNSSGYPDPTNTPDSYKWFCTALENMGKSRNPKWSGEQVEQAMFDVRRGEWRKHLWSIYGKVGSTKTKKSKAEEPTKLPPTTSQQVSRNAAPVPVGVDSLPARIAGAHTAAYRAGCDLPGATPQVGAARPVRVHCRLIDGVLWQYAFQQNNIHAEVFIPAEHVARYDMLRRFLGVNNHDFGDHIVGNGAANGKTRSVKLTLNRGLNAPQNEWDEIAKESVSNMKVLFNRVCEYL